MPHRLVKTRLGKPVVRFLSWLLADELTPAIIRWSVVGGGCGIAQLYRSPLEVYVGTVYIAAATVTLAGFWRRSQAVVTIGFAALTAAFMARGLSGWAIPNATWHGSLILALAWCSMARGVGVWALRLAQGEQRW